MVDENRLAELRAQQSALKKLLEGRGWAELKRALEEQIRGRRQRIFGLEFKGIEDLSELLRTRGEIAGLLLAIQMPELMLEDLREDIQQMLEEDREEKENE
ncbi:MAG: hypothetical protein JRI39_00340 [Deltaproteobacteria bacterium]|nr:hypothetical protein [Deltaproteobacteria bacterium]